MTLYISTGDGVVVYDAVYLYWGDLVVYVTVDRYWGLFVRVCRFRSLLGTYWWIYSL